MRLLLTRPIDQARETAARLEALGHAVVFAPMLVIEPLDASPIATGGLAALVITSARAVEVLMGRPEIVNLRALPAFAVGERTADVLRSAGFERIVSAGADAVALARLVRECLAPGDGTVLYACGRDRRGDLDVRLREAGFAVDLVELYAAQRAQALPADAARALETGRIDAVLVYSRRTAEAFAETSSTAGLDLAGLRVVAISGAAAEPLAASGAHLTIAATPDETGMLACLQSRT